MFALEYSSLLFVDDGIVCSHLPTQGEYSCDAFSFERQHSHIGSSLSMLNSTSEQIADARTRIHLLGRLSNSRVGVHCAGERAGVSCRCMIETLISIP